MKRIAFTFAALTILSVSAAKAADDVEFKWSGEFRARYENDMHTTGYKDYLGGDSYSGFNHRFKLNMTARKGENTSATISLINADATSGTKGWGTGNSATTGPNGAGVKDTNSTSNLLLVNRAWGWWKANDSLSFKFGRVGLEFADGSVFAENDWEQVPTSHDGVVGAWDMDFSKVTFFGIRNTDGGIGYYNNDAQTNTWGLVFDLKNMPAAIKTAEVYFLQINTDEPNGVPTTTAPLTGVNNQRVGIAVGGDVSGFLYKADGAYVFGKNKVDTSATPGTEVDHTVSASMYDLMVGYSMPSAMGFKITANYHSDTGDKGDADKTQQYDPLYYDRHNHAGLMDVLRWGNLNYWDAVASIMPMDDLEVGLGYYMFNRTETTGTTNFGPGINGTTYGTSPALNGTVVADTDKGLGSEIDLYANKAFDGGIKVGARLGAFMPGNGIKNLTTTQNGATLNRDQTIYQGFLQASYGF
jgi:hypothetical protein